MPSGKLKFFNEAREFGFIVPADGHMDVFVHASAFKRAGISMQELTPGMGLDYDVEPNPRSRKPTAVRLRLHASTSA